jgi:hypothetical protein
MTTTTEPGPAPVRRRRALVVTAALALIAIAATLGVILWPRPPGPVVLHAASAHYSVTATVETPRVGSTAVEVELGGGPGTTVTIQAVMPQMGHATPPVTAAPAGAGRYRAAGIPLLMTGPWELQLSIGSGGAVEHLTLPLVVSG